MTGVPFQNQLLVIGWTSQEGMASAALFSSLAALRTVGKFYLDQFAEDAT